MYIWLKSKINPKNQKIMKKVVVLLFVSIIVLSCSNPVDKPYKKDTLEEDIIEIKKKVTDEELETLAGYIALQELAEESMLGKTYAELLDEAKQLQEKLKEQEEEERLLAEEARVNEAKRIEKLNNSLTVSMFDKGYSEYKYDEYITMKFAFHNKTEKDIRAFTGTVVINDLFDKEIQKINLTYDDGVLANSKKNWNAQTEYNQFKDEDVALKNKDMEDLKVVWKPEKIIYSDGTTLE